MNKSLLSSRNALVARPPLPSLYNPQNGLLQSIPMALRTSLVHIHAERLSLAVLTAPHTEVYPIAARRQAPRVVRSWRAVALVRRWTCDLGVRVTWCAEAAERGMATAIMSECGGAKTMFL